MMDHLVTLTYRGAAPTEHGALRRSASSTAASSARSARSAAGCTCRPRATAPLDVVAARRSDDDVEVRRQRHRHRLHDRRPGRVTTGRPRPSRSSTPSVLLDGASATLGGQDVTGVPADEVRAGHAGQAPLEAGRRAHDRGQERPGLGQRRRVIDVVRGRPASPTSRKSASRSTSSDGLPPTSPSWAGPRRRRSSRSDATEPQLCLQANLGGHRHGRHQPLRHRLHLRRELRLPDRRALRLRRQPRGRRGLAAHLRVPRGDGRRLGPVRGVGAPAARRHRRRPGLRLGEVVAVQPGRAVPPAARPVLPRAARARPRLDRRHAGPGLLDAGKATERDFAEVAARSLRDAASNPNAQPRAATTIPIALLQEPTTSAPRCGPTTAPGQRRGRRRRPGHGRPGPPADRAPRCSSGASTTASRPTSPACATWPRRRRPPWPAGRRASTRRPDRRGRAVRPVTAPGGHPARRPRARRRGHGQPVGRRVRRQPGHGHRPRSASSKRPAGSPTARPTGPLAHATNGQALQQNLVCILEGGS